MSFFAKPGVNLLMALKLPGQVYDEGNFFPKEEPSKSYFWIGSHGTMVGKWLILSQILPVISVVRDLDFF